MRTTIDLPDELYRTLKARAALSGVTLRELIADLIARGMRQPMPEISSRRGDRPGPPVIIHPRGLPIAATDTADLRRIEEQEDISRSA